MPCASIKSTSNSNVTTVRVVPVPDCTSPSQTSIIINHHSHQPIPRCARALIAVVVFLLLLVVSWMALQLLLLLLCWHIATRATRSTATNVRSPCFGQHQQERRNLLPQYVLAVRPLKPSVGIPTDAKRRNNMSVCLSLSLVT